jgi:2-keto-4-pentenoate hydratase/2-oxohepta-3-ene-1,7-dioic acid hydratase in catechol pathway
MRIARFSLDGTVAFGVVESPDPLREFDLTEAQVRPMRGHPFGEPDLVDVSVPLSSVKLLAPVLPTKVIGIGKNYQAHIDELTAIRPHEPLMFLKPSTSVVGPGAAIQLPSQAERVDHEGELAVVIGRMCRHVAAEDAESVILGYTCANDVTARDLQSRDGQWARAKGFDTFCPLGPWIVTDVDPGSLDIAVEVNGEQHQHGSTADMIFGVGALVEWASSVMTLLPGDVILTGTPSGISQLTDGDHVRVTIAGIGSLDNEVVLGD